MPSRVAAISRFAPHDKATILARADAILAGRFPISSTATAPYAVSLAPDFSWRDSPLEEKEFLHALNRHRFWRELAMAFRFTGDTKYSDEIERQFRSWIEENPRPEDFENWRDNGVPWWLLNAAIRADTWIWTYFLLLDSPAWTPEWNALFLHHLHGHGEYLEALTPKSGGNNWVVMQAQGLLNIALLFPEWKQSARWERHAAQTLSNCFQAQFHADGGHFEQSPDYHAGCIRWFLEPFFLAQLNGRDWMEEHWAGLRQSCEFFHQILWANTRKTNSKFNCYENNLLDGCFVGKTLL